MNAKQFADYQVTKGFHCGGEPIKLWDDGSSSNYGKLKGISNCERMCDMHVECDAFAHDASIDICGYWTRGPLKLIKSNILICHRKLRGSRILYLYG